MSYFVAIEGRFGLKPVGRTIYPTHKEAETVARRLAWIAKGTGTYHVMDVDHEPGRSLLIERHERLAT